MGFDVTQVQKALKGVSYPASSDNLAEHAANNNADPELVDALRNIDRGSLDGPDQVMREMRDELGNN
jgi:hypothetical protein